MEESRPVNPVRIRRLLIALASACFLVCMLVFDPAPEVLLIGFGCLAGIGAFYVYARRREYWQLQELIQKNPEAAIPRLTQALKTDPANVGLYNSRGTLYFRTGRPELARRDIEKAIELDPKNPAGYVNRAILSLREGNFDDAMGDCNQAISLATQPEGSAFAYLYRGVASYLKGDLSGALADFDTSYRFTVSQQIVPLLHALLDGNRGKVHYVQGQFEQAMIDFQKSQQLAPSQACQVGLALTHHALGQADDAKRLWRSLLDEDARYVDVDWVKREHFLAPPLMEEARKLLAEL